MTRIRTLIALACGVALLLVAAPAYATDFPVTRADDPAPGTCDPGDCSLREAFVSAEASGGPDSISVPAGTYRLDRGALPTVTQDLDVTGDDAAGTVITGSVAKGPGTGSRAGAIYHTGGVLTLSKLSIHGNTVTVDNPATQSITNSAGGILSESSGGLVLVDSVVSGNTAMAYGTSSQGGVFASKLTITNSEVTGNVATASVGPVGGVAAAQIDMTGTTVSGNSTGGSATGATGGIAVGTGNITSSTIDTNSVSGTTLTVGTGGLSTYKANVSNTTISGNTATARSATFLIGGVEVRGDITIASSTVARNSARDAGSVYAPTGGLTLTSSVLATASARNCWDAVVSGGGNVADDDTCGLTAAGGDRPNAAALLGPLTDNGGPTRTHTLRPASAALDAVPPGGTCPALDQRGFARPVGSGCDSGAVEVTPDPPVAAALPAVTGAASIGDALTCAPGTWSGEPSFAFAWLRNGAPIADAAGATYVVTRADAGTAVQCRVTATNAGGSAIATSAPVVTRGAAPSDVANTTRPSIHGRARVRGRVTCAVGSWIGEPAFAFAWLRGGRPIAGATGERYRPKKRDRGRALQCVVVGSRGGVSVAAESTPKVVGKAKAKHRRTR